MKYESYAIWPDHVYTNEFGKHVSYDTHDSKEQAQAVCNLLHQRGFGGNGKDFPLETGVNVIGEDAK